MAKKKNVTIAGIDPDEWLSIDAHIDSTEEVVARKYDKKIIAFLDLLAMKDLILNKKRKPGEEIEAFEIIEQIKSIVEIETRSLDRDHNFVLLQLSDSFIFTCSDEDIAQLILLLGTIQMRILVECKFQLRGAITYGDVYIADEGKQIIGPAYIEAYLLQENNAIYPRIILSNAFVDRMGELNHTPSGVVLSADSEDFIDYLSIYLQTESKNRTDIITHLKRQNVFSFLQQHYNQYRSNNNYSVKQKYGWTISYFKNKGVWPK
uniref:Uncharacterized protein n=1 Tax=Geobacter sp. (strain M21) TaxID=443144 RepID=C6DYA7_GEOSM